VDQRTRGPEPIRVILADDHTLVREGTRRILEATNTVSVVAEAADGAQAVEVVDLFEPDVAIIDIGMPGINGIEATRRIKRAHPRVGVLVLSMHDDDQFIFAVLEAGAAGYLLKDVAGHQLVNAVEAVHAGESVLHPAVAHKVLARLASGLQGNSLPDTEEPLTARETEVLRLAARGMANKQIGVALDVSVRTVQAHLTSVFHKLGVGSRTEAVLHSLRRGWFSIEELEPP
jgi:two-component system, NarL family, response regulator LiaR